MRSLFDVNLLLALFDSAHIHHRTAHRWWSGQRERDWASCPLTENGFLRIISSHAYPNPLPLGSARSLLRAQTDLPEHAFWPDDISISDAALFDGGHPLHPRQITDVYLLALAVKHGGRLVTFDRAIQLSAVHGAQEEHLVIL